MPHRRQPGQRAGLTRSRVLVAASELLVDRGVDGLTMRALAGHLGVSPNALYSHVRSKTALVDDLLDDVLAGVHAPAPDSGDPLGGVHALMTSTYQVLLAQADLIPLYLTRQGARGPNAQHLGDVMLALLAHAGVTGSRAGQALHVLIVYTIGSAAFATRSPLATGQVPRRSGEDQDYAGPFDHGLRWILAGISRPG